jgi:hypothetical protein
MNWHFSALLLGGVFFAWIAIASLGPIRWGEHDDNTWYDGDDDGWDLW